MTEQQVPVITDAPDPQPTHAQHPQGTPEPQGVSLQVGDVLIAEGDMQYKIPDTAGKAAFDEIPPIRRVVMAARLRSIADMLD